MKIIHYIPSIDRTAGGTTAYMQLLGKPLGQLVDLHIVSHASANEVEIPNCTIHRISSSVLGAMKAEWTQLLDTIQPDVVHVNCCWLPQMAFAQKWAQQKGYKVVLTPHGMLEPWIMARNYWTKKVPALCLYQRKAVRKADWIHSTAASEKANLLHLGYNDKITVIPNGIEVENIRLKTSWQPKKTMLFLSRVHVKKGIDLLMEAVAQLRSKLQDYTFVIAGEGDANYIQQLKTKAEQLGVGAQFDFVGGVYGEDKWRLFREADVFVLPTHSENFGIVVAEALASGTPVITTTGTPWQELNTRACGWWIENTLEIWTKTLTLAIDLDEESLKRLGLNGRRLVEEKYSIGAVAKEMELLYQQLIDN